MFFSSRASNIPSLPAGYLLETERAPTPEALNKLLSQCREDTHSPRRLALALERSLCNLSILEEGSGKLAGFVRVTSDHGLNANLWNLVAIPGATQEILLAVLVEKAMGFIRRDMPGCSVSVAAPISAVRSLKDQGFLLDPGGIRTMGFKLR